MGATSCLACEEGDGNSLSLIQTQITLSTLIYKSTWRWKSPAVYVESVVLPAQYCLNAVQMISPFNPHQFFKGNAQR